MKLPSRPSLTATGLAPLPGQILAQQGQRVASKRQANIAIVLDDLPALGHGLQLRRRLVEFGRLWLVEQRQGGVAQGLDRPHCLTPVELEAGQIGVGFGKLSQHPGLEARSPPEVVDRRVGLVTARGDQGRDFLVDHALDHPEPQPHGQAVLLRGRLQGAVPP